VTPVNLDPATILSACRLFDRVRGESLDRLVGMSVMRRFEAGEPILHEGDACPGVFVVGTGLVRVYKVAPSGREQVLHLVAPGGTFAEVAAIGDFDVPANAEALEETTCILLPVVEFHRALGDDPRLCQQVLLGMAVWVRHLLGMVEDIGLRDATGRVARYLLSASDDASGEIRLPSLKRHLASHLNLTSETLSRTLRRLADQKVIESGPDTLRVLDRDRLASLAQGDEGRL
jgi:CRP/FNR family transcriptional regulator, dissimilatory nitrate respiration regulator